MPKNPALFPILLICMFGIFALGTGLLCTFYTVQAEIVKSKIIAEECQYQGSLIYCYSGNLTLQYTINGTIYNYTMIVLHHPFELWTLEPYANPVTIQRLLDHRYPVGKLRIYFYQPSNPEVVTPPRAIFIVTATLTVLGFLGAIGIFIGWKFYCRYEDDGQL